MTVERDRLVVEIQELKAQVGADSGTSNVPPSQDKPWKPLSERIKTGRFPGGQPGHIGKTLEMSAQPDTVIVFPVSGQCACGHSWVDVPIQDVLARQVHDLPETRLHVTEYQVEVKICPHCAQRQQAAFPAAVPGQVQYGPHVHALTTFLNVVHFIPLARTAEIVATLYGSAPSDGTILLNLNVAAERLKDFEAQVKVALLAEPVLYADETGSKVNGKLQWLHILTCASYTLYGHHRSRGYDALVAMGVLPDYRGTLMHDAWRTYLALPMDHALCNAHLLRELRGLHEFFGQEWAGELRRGIQLVYHQRKTKTLTGDGIVAFKAHFDTLVTAGLETNPATERTAGQRGRVKQSRARNVALRCQRYKREMLRFLDDDRMPFDNNLAEQGIRMMCGKRKASGGFRSALGGEVFCRIRSYVATLHKQGMNVWDGLVSVFAGDVLLPVCLG
ncbi:IS66 family transposase (plasmid) [Deinococcus radiomollis]|uniref:IS66 family transposase n=1 Tax=Deinococcus radiomollis TaxID=468916 RepID=UPI00389248F5